MKKQQIFKNNFEVALAQPVGALDTTIYVAAPGNVPQLELNDAEFEHADLTITEGDTINVVSAVRTYPPSGDMQQIDISRIYEGEFPGQAFTVAAKVSIRLTAQAANAMYKGRFCVPDQLQAGIILKRWQPNELVSIGDVRVSASLNIIATCVLDGATDSVEPAWDVDTVVNDYDAVWRCNYSGLTDVADLGNDLLEFSSTSGGIILQDAASESNGGSIAIGENLNVTARKALIIGKDSFNYTPGSRIIHGVPLLKNGQFISDKAVDESDWLYYGGGEEAVIMSSGVYLGDVGSKLVNIPIPVGAKFYISEVGVITMYNDATTLPFVSFGSVETSDSSVLPATQLTGTNPGDRDRFTTLSTYKGLQSLTASVTIGASGGGGAYGGRIYFKGLFIEDDF